MQLAAKTLVIFSVLGGMFLVSLTPTKIDWPPLVPIIFTGAIGILLITRME